MTDASGSTAPASIRPVTEYELLFDCVHCGLCLEACPTYALTRAEMDSPRGRIYLMKALAEGRLELDADAVRHLDSCLGCRGCETACPSGVRYGRLIEETRAYVEEHSRRGFGDRLRRTLASAIFPYPTRLRALLAPLRLLEKLRLRSTLVRVLPRSLREPLELLPPLATSSRDYGSKPESQPVADAPVVVVHYGCVTQVLANSENLNSERLLRAAGYRTVQLRETACCGALDLHGGNRARAREFVRTNVRALRETGDARIVSNAAGCTAAIAEYGELLKDEPALASDAAKVSARVSDLATLLLARKPPKFRELPYTVAYHDACHLAHGRGVRESPRHLLASVPGIKLVELAETDMCCGSAGTYNLMEPAMARELARRKADNVVATGADYLVLANPGCEFQIAAELRRRGTRTRVAHLADFLAMALDD